MLVNILFFLKKIVFFLRKNKIKKEKNQTSTSNIPIGFKNNSFEMAINLRKSPKALKSKSAIYPSISMLKNDSQKRY